MQLNLDLLPSCLPIAVWYRLDVRSDKRKAPRLSVILCMDLFFLVALQLQVSLLI
jgi:hypothetical protein